MMLKKIEMENMTQVNTMRNMAIDMGSELENQNRKIDRIDHQVTMGLCKFCAKLISKKHLNRHEKGCSLNDSKQEFECPNCACHYSRLDSLKIHIENCKQNQSKSSKKNIKCLYGHCSMVFYHKTSLIEHLQHKHQCNIDQPIILSFSDTAQFYKWKEEEENKSYSYFPKQTGKSVSGKHETIYYYCQHDTRNEWEINFKRKTSRRRHYGQVKSGNRCLSMIQLKVEKNGTCNAKYFPTHSHPLTIEDWKYQPQLSSTNQFIDQQISLNVSPTKILQSLKLPMTNEGRDGAIHNKLTKAQLLTRNVIRLRAMKKKIAKRHHEDDATSIFLMAEAMKAEDPDKIIIFKPLGQNCSVGPTEVNNLPDAETLFMFGFQTKNQRELMLKENSVLIIDKTHSTNQYDYLLLTCLVTDKNNAGWPVAHLITSRLDGETLQYFFKSLKLKCPEITVNCVITDDDGALTNALMDGFQDFSINHILCKWHLHTNWKAKLRELAFEELFQEMYLGLILLSETKCVNEFNNLSDAFKSKYEVMAPSFFEYFEQEYMMTEERIRKWASCCRNNYHGNVTTIGHVESFHNRLKTVYLNKKPSKRVDDLIQILLSIENEDYCRRKTFGINAPVNESHSEGLKIADSLVIADERGDTHWVIKSSRKEECVVTKIQDECSKDLCLFKCSEPPCLNLCSHLYICTCPDVNNLCKHVHKVHSSVYGDFSGEENNVLVLELFTSSNSPDTSNKNGVMQCQEKLETLLSLLKTGNMPDEMIDLTSATVDELLKRCEAYNQTMC